MATVSSYLWQGQTTGLFAIESIEADQYVTGITFTGTLNNLDGSNQQSINLYICDQNGGNAILLGSKSLARATFYPKRVSSSDKDGNLIWIDQWEYEKAELSEFNKYGQTWTALSGKTVCLKKDGGTQMIIWPGATINISKAYISRNISLGNYSGGTVTLSKASGIRGEKITVSITPAAGSQLTGITTSAGTLTKINDLNYTLTMPTPAVDVTISPSFKTTIFNITKKVEPAGAGTITCPDTATYDTSVNISQTKTNDEYKFQSWTITDRQVSGESGSFIMPEKNITVQANYLRHKLTWDSQGLTAVQREYVITFTNNGRATDNFGREIKYYLYKENTKVSEFTNNIATYTLTEQEAESESELTFHIEAENTITVKGQYITFSSKPVHRTVGYYKGDVRSTYDDYGNKKDVSVFTECIMYYRLPRDLSSAEKETILPTDDELEKTRKQIKNAGFVEVEPYIYMNGSWTLCSLK